MKVFILRISKNNNESYSSYSVWNSNELALNFFKKSFEQNIGSFLSSTLNYAALALLDQDKIEECINLINLYTKDYSKCVDSVSISNPPSNHPPNVNAVPYGLYPSTIFPATISYPYSTVNYNGAISNVSYDQYKFSVSIIESELKGNVFDIED
jgi:hypothetical protein